MPSRLFKIVGAFYRMPESPAQALLSILPGFTELMLKKEPDNEADPNAIGVFVSTKVLKTLSPSTIDEACNGCGFPSETILAAETWPLGYIPKDVASWLNSKLSDNTSAQLCFMPDGKPGVKVELE